MSRGFLTEGGAVGHLSHLWDNHELTFAEIKDVITSAAEGKLEKVSEKLDGMNLVFTYDMSQDDIRVARTGSDIPRGGMDAAALAKKFFGRGNVELAFNTAFKVLRDSVGALPVSAQSKIFGDNGNTWYSLEIIYAPDPNTVNYDSNNIVFHGYPVLQLKNGKVTQKENAVGIDILTKNIERMQNAVTLRDWKVRGPSMMNLKKISDGSIVQTALSKIDSAMSDAGVSDSNTVYDYLRSLMSEEVASLDLPEDAARAVVERCIEIPGAPGVPEIKSMLDPSDGAAAANFVRSSGELLKKMTSPIEMAIHNFAIEVLRGLKSTLIDDSDAEVARLRNQVARSIKAIESSGNQTAMDILNKEMSRLGNVENVNAAMEGIVFIYKGNAYKFTGSFAAAHQIVSLFKYGRKGVPKMDLGESYRRIINEGGHAFPDVKPVKLDDFKELWPKIKADIMMLGANKVEWIGTTGKKNLMGDVDLVASFDGTRDEFFSDAGSMFGASNVKKIGSNIVTVRYPSENSFFQMDIMLGDTDYISWSRFGPSNIESHSDYSPVKGIVRNVLLNVINRFAAEKLFPQQSDENNRVKYIVDFDKGLHKVNQKFVGGASSGRQWKTVKSELISSKPDDIVAMMFGNNYKANDLRKFEDVVAAVRSSPKLSDISEKILTTFEDEIKQLVKKQPNILGDDPSGSLEHIDDVINA